MFTHKLRILICILLEYTPHNGISSKTLGDMLWGEKPKDKIKNSRNVTINNLRKVLAEIDGIELMHINDSYILNISQPFYCDYYNYINILRKEDLNIKDLMQIIRRGKLLNNFDDPVLDEFKSQYEHHIIPILLKEIKHAYTIGDYNMTILLAQITFYADPLNATAFDLQIKSLKKLGKVSEAQTIIKTFNKEYRKAFGEAE